MFDSLKKAFDAYSKKPFLFVWSTLLYIFMLVVFLFAAVGIFLLYFMFLSLFGQELELDAIPTLAVFGVIGLLLIIFLNGINASLAWAYKRGLTKSKTSLAQFYSYALDKAPEAFGIEVLRNFFMLLTIGPAIGAYIYFLEGMEYMDILIGAYVLFVTFVLHMIFTPAIVILSAFDSSFYNSLKYGLELLRKRHIFFIGLYVVFAFVWLFNFIPFLQIVTLFFVYPVCYSAMAIMARNTIKVEEGEDE